MCVLFNGSLCITIVSYYSPTNVSDETDITTFYDGLSSLAQHIPKHNILIIGRDKKAQICKGENDKFGLYKLPNRNGEYPTDFSVENSLSCLNIKLKKKEGKRWNYTELNNDKVWLDNILINKKWRNSDLNCKAHSSFEGVFSDLRIATAEIHLS